MKNNHYLRKMILEDSLFDNKKPVFDFELNNGKCCFRFDNKEEYESFIHYINIKGFVSFGRSNYHSIVMKYGENFLMQQLRGTWCFANTVDEGYVVFNFSDFDWSIKESLKETKVSTTEVDSNDISVDHPNHYNSGKYEVIDVIEDWKLGFNLGNAIKYIGRCEHKKHKVEDLKKAIWYIEREIGNEK